MHIHIHTGHCSRDHTWCASDPREPLCPYALHGQLLWISRQLMCIFILYTHRHMYTYMYVMCEYTVHVTYTMYTCTSLFLRYIHVGLESLHILWVCCSATEADQLASSYKPRQMKAKQRNYPNLINMNPNWVFPSHTCTSSCTLYMYTHKGKGTHNNTYMYMYI